MESEPDCDALIRSAVRGDPAALDVLLRDVYPRVRTMVHRELGRGFRRHHKLLLPLFSTGDVVQEVFLRAVQDLAQFAGTGEAALISWLATQVKHRILDLVRHHEAQRRDRRRELALETALEATTPAPAASPSRCAEGSEFQAAWQELLAELSQPQRSLLEARLDQGRPWQEIAAQLGFPTEDAARFALRRLQARLMVKLARRGISPPGVGPGGPDGV